MSILITPAGYLPLSGGTMTGNLGFASANTISWNGDTTLTRDSAANTLALVNGANLGEFRVYGAAAAAHWAGIKTSSTTRAAIGAFGDTAMDLMIVSGAANHTLFNGSGGMQSQGNNSNSYAFDYATNASSLTGANASIFFNIAQTWNTSANPTLIKAVVTRTAVGSTSTSKFLDFQLAATGSVFNVDALGTLTVNQVVQSVSGNALQLQSVGSANLYLAANSTVYAAVRSASSPAGWFSVTNASGLGFSSDSTAFGTLDLGLYRNAAGVLEINTGTAGTLAALKCTSVTTTGNVVNAATSTINYGGSATGLVNVMAATCSPAITAYTTGAFYICLANLANTTTTPTVNFNAVGAKTIVKRAATALAAGDYAASMMCFFIYDGTNMQLLNPVVN